MKKYTPHICALIASLLMYFNSSSIVMYLILTLITVALVHIITKLLRQFKLHSIFKKIGTIFFILFSVLLILSFYFIVNDAPDLCTVGPNTKAKNYFTGETKDFYCGITPWYYEDIPGQNAKIFPVVVPKP